MPGERRTIDDGRHGEPDLAPGDIGTGAPASADPPSGELSTLPESTADGGILDWVVDNFTSEMMGDPGAALSATHNAPDDVESASAPADDGNGTEAIDPPDPPDLFY